MTHVKMVQNRLTKRIYYERKCTACDGIFYTDIDLMHFCDKCLSMDDIIDYLHSDANNEWSK